MAGLPRSYIKKYGVTKKAWAMYRASKGGRKRKKTKRVGIMARRYRKRFGFYRRKYGRRARIMGGRLLSKNNMIKTGGGIVLGSAVVPRFVDVDPQVSGAAGGGVGGYMGAGLVGGLVGAALGWISGRPLNNAAAKIAPEIGRPKIY